jgi:uncharacterized protein (DUF58 family)
VSQPRGEPTSDVQSPGGPRPVAGAVRGRGVRPSRWAAVALGAVALALVALQLPPVLGAIAVAVVAGCVGLDMVIARNRRPTFDRTGLPVLARQVPVPFRLSATVDQARPVRIRQPVPPELAVSPSESRGAALEGSLTGRHRGVHTLAPAVLRVSGPLGFGTCDHTGPPPAPVTVFPDLPRARRLAIAQRRGRSGEESRIRSRLGLGTEFESIRDYSPNDDVRQVNWLATARVGRPMTNQYRVEENRDVIFLVDAGRLMASPVGAATRLDVALDAVAVLAVAAEEAGDRVGATAFAGDVLRQLSPRRRGAQTVVETLFDLEPTEVESDYERAFQSVGGGKRALIALFTDLVDAAAARTLVAAVPVLTRRHAVLVATCTDPGLRAAVTTPPDDTVGVMRERVALEMLSARRRAAALLRAMGATTVEAGPRNLGPACVNAYARLKQRARL